MCLAEGDNAVPPVRLEPATPWSRVKHSTTELLNLALNLKCENYKDTVNAKYQNRITKKGKACANK